MNRRGFGCTSCHTLSKFDAQKQRLSLICFTVGWVHLDAHAHTAAFAQHLLLRLGCCVPQHTPEFAAVSHVMHGWVTHSHKAHTQRLPRMTLRIPGVHWSVEARGTKQNDCRETGDRQTTVKTTKTTGVTQTRCVQLKRGRFQTKINKNNP